MTEKEKALKLLRKLPERKQTEFYYMVLGALFTARERKIMR